MDDIHYLRYRNIELETELRLVKEQLAQAQNGTQYLVNCVATTRNYCSSANPKGIQFRSMPDNSNHMRAQLGINHIDDHYTYGTPTLGNTCALPKRSHGHLHPSTSTSDEAELTSAVASREDDLLTFNAHDDSPTITNVQSQMQSPDGKHVSRTSFTRSSSNRSAASHTPDKTLYVGDAKPREVGLGISNLGLRDLDKHDSPLGLHLERHHLNGHGESSTQLRAPSPSRPKSRFSGIWTSIHAPPTPEPEPIFETAFLDGEHNRLLNSACFIEEMTGEEKEQHWIMLGREKDRHSAKEWKQYYERLIMPAYRAKSKTIETASSGKETEAQTVERTSSNPPTKTYSLPPQFNAGTPDTKHQSSPLAERREEAVPNLAQETSPTHKPENVHSRPSSKAERVEDGGVKLLEPLEVIKFDDVALSGTFQNSPAAIGSTMELGAHTPNLDTPASSFGDRKTEIFTPRTSSSIATNSPSTGPQITPISSRPLRFPSFPREVPQVLFNPNVKDSSHFRTILISKIASGITLAQVVSGIRGGRIVKAIFLQTKGMKTSPPMATNTAMIEFLNADEAATAIENSIRDSLVTLTTKNVQLEAQLLRTPTRQIHPKLEFDMRERGLTRVFYAVCEAEPTTAEMVMEGIVRRNSEQNRPLVAGERDDGVLFFEFADVRDAAMAWEVVEFDRGRLRGIKKGFLPDPCAVEGGSKEREGDCASGSDADDEDEGENTVANTRAASFEEHA